MTKKLGTASAAFLLAVVMGGLVYLSRPAVAPVRVSDCIEGVLDPRGPVVGQVCGEPAPAPPPDEPPPSPAPPEPPRVEPTTWPCEDLHTLSSRQRAEDAWLREILASPLDWPPWGVPEWAAEAAECAAYRDRVAWMGGR